MNSTKIIHRLLFDALLEIRSECRKPARAECGAEVGYSLSDLFHTVVLDLERAALGEINYDEVLAELTKRAEERGGFPALTPYF